jgi:thymidylate kinase
VIDGLDGIGKGEVERAIIQYEQRLGRAVFDSISFSRACRKGLPELSDFWDPPEVYYDTLTTAEPTYAGIGHNIRFEIIANNGRDYSAKDQIQAYSLDRLVQMVRVTLPALENGLNVVQSRSCASTLCYQSVIAEDEGKDPKETRRYILEQEGNRFQLQHAPNLLIIPLIKDEEELIKRLTERRDTTKDDNAIFENARFQRRLNPLYQSTWLREIFESKGTRVEYLDTWTPEYLNKKQEDSQSRYTQDS